MSSQQGPKPTRSISNLPPPQPHRGDGEQPSNWQKHSCPKLCRLLARSQADAAHLWPSRRRSPLKRKTTDTFATLACPKLCLLLTRRLVITVHFWSSRCHSPLGRGTRSGFNWEHAPWRICGGFNHDVGWYRYRLNLSAALHVPALQRFSPLLMFVVLVPSVPRFENEARRLKVGRPKFPRVNMGPCDERRSDSLLDDTKRCRSGKRVETRPLRWVAQREG